jgi:hypothetical protein
MTTLPLLLCTSNRYTASTRQPSPRTNTTLRIQRQAPGSLRIDLVLVDLASLLFLLFAGLTAGIKQLPQFG